MSWYLKVLKSYALFSGRARRKEYWWFTAISLLVSIGFILIGELTGMQFLQPIYVLATILPVVGVSIRRLHDTGRAGWWGLIGLIPIIGAIVLLVFMAQDSNAEENQYGPAPKAIMV